jgi:copper homeostasis protein (lipoprotein)
LESIILSLRPRAALSAFVLCASLSTGCAPPHPAGYDPTAVASGHLPRIEGTATYRERMALPPGAIFEAFLEDVSIADARSTVVARATIHGPSQPPIQFSIPYDPARIDSRRAYAVRARILFDDRAQFKSEGEPVLTRGAGRSVDLLLHRGDPGVGVTTPPPQLPRAEEHSRRASPPTIPLPAPPSRELVEVSPPPQIDEVDTAPPMPPAIPPPARTDEEIGRMPASPPVRIDEEVEKAPVAPTPAPRPQQIREEVETTPAPAVVPPPAEIEENAEKAPQPPPATSPPPRTQETVEKMPKPSVASSPPKIPEDAGEVPPAPPQFPPLGERQLPPMPVPLPSRPAMPGIGAHGMRLPATFRGDFPCADCEAIRYQLNLWPDQSFQLRREWVGRDQTLDVIGRWRVEPDRNALVLYAGDDALPQFEIVGEDHLRPLGMRSTPSGTVASPYELVSQGTLDPIDPSLTFGGEMIYLADAARFTECLTGRDYPIAMEGEYLQLERAYLETVREPGARLYVTFEGTIRDRPKMDGPGAERTIVVSRFINAWPDQQCERAQAHASLTNTYWRIDRLDGKPVERVEDRREPHLILRREEIDLTYGATVGCNQMGGTFALDGEKIQFRPGVSTLMACTPALDATEKLLGEVLTRTARWRISGGTLELFDSSGKSVGLFEAVYL